MVEPRIGGIVLLKHPACPLSFLKLSETQGILLDNLINELLGINTSLVQFVERLMDKV
jgi:hypothetical protein